MRRKISERLQTAYDQGRVVGAQEAEKKIKSERQALADDTVRECVHALRTISYMLLRTMVRP